MPYSGVPFAQVGTMGLECHMGRIPKFKPSKSGEIQEEESPEVDEGEVLSLYKYVSWFNVLCFS